MSLCRRRASFTNFNLSGFRTPSHFRVKARVILFPPLSHIDFAYARRRKMCITRFSTLEIYFTVLGLRERLVRIRRVWTRSANIITVVYSLTRVFLAPPSPGRRWRLWEKKNPFVTRADFGTEIAASCCIREKKRLVKRVPIAAGHRISDLGRRGAGTFENFTRINK